MKVYLLVEAVDTEDRNLRIRKVRDALQRSTYIHNTASKQAMDLATPRGQALPASHQKAHIAGMYHFNRAGQASSILAKLAAKRGSPEHKKAAKDSASWAWFKRSYQQRHKQ